MKCLAVASVLVFASVCSASVFDDAQFLLQGDADVNGDGIITQGEARNAIDRNSENSLELGVCGSVDGVDRGISCPETEIDLPRRGETVSGKVIRLRTLTRKSDFDGGRNRLGQRFLHEQLLSAVYGNDSRHAFPLGWLRHEVRRGCF